MRIELCGGIAAGKTTFSSSIKALQSKYMVVFEEFSNEFLADFYNNPTYYAFETELYFLINHLHQIKVALQKSDFILCDFSLELDRVYASINLKNDEWTAYERVYQEALRGVRRADCIVLLDCSVDVMIERIIHRGRKGEVAVDKDYQKRIVDGIKKHLKEAGIKTLELNSEENDLRNCETVYNIISSEPFTHWFI